MNTPTVALAWEVWRRHRTRLIILIGILLGFVFVYPKLCALADFNPGNHEVTDEIATKLGFINHGTPTLMNIVHVLYMLALGGGPAAAMVMTLLFMTWIATFTEFEPATKDPIKFNARRLALPVSTNFLFWWHFLAGLAGVVGVYTIWVLCVRLPHMEVFSPFKSCFGWITLLALAQGITWALAAWPNTKTILLAATFFCFVCSPSHPEAFESPLILLPLFSLGAVMARAGMQKMRHGQWQGWTWTWPFTTTASSVELRRLEKFSSPARAQLWFEWRRFTSRISFFTASLVLVPVVILLMRAAVFGPLEEDAMYSIITGLVGAPLLIYFCFSASPGRTDQSFVMVRPLTNGEMVMAMLKAAAISAAFSWAAVCLALSVMPLLGDFHLVEQYFPTFPGCRAAILLGFAFLTWRMMAVNLCFVLPENRWLASVPAWLVIIVAFLMGAVAFNFQDYVNAHYALFLQRLPGLLTLLVAMKFLLAFLAFRASLKRRLLAPSALIGYLAVWILLVVGWLTAALAILHLNKVSLPLLPLSLAIVLLVPLARIGLAPIALARNRHT